MVYPLSGGIPETPQDDLWGASYVDTTVMDGSILEWQKGDGGTAVHQGACCGLLAAEPGVESNQVLDKSVVIVVVPPDQLLIVSLIIQIWRIRRLSYNPRIAMAELLTIAGHDQFVKYCVARVAW